MREDDRFSLARRSNSLTRRGIRFSVGVFQAVRRCVWRLTRPRTFGVDGIPVTASGQVVLVKLTYAKGWRLPGGRRRRSEDPADAVLRELREEIGLSDYSSIHHVGGFFQTKDHRRDHVDVFVIHDVEYRPRRSVEVDAIAEFGPSRLPADANHARKWVGEAKQQDLLEWQRLHDLDAES